jgi:hypothetical protein
MHDRVLLGHVLLGLHGPMITEDTKIIWGPLGGLYTRGPEIETKQYREGPIVGEENIAFGDSIN